MPFIAPLSFSFAALRRFNVEHGVGEVVAVLFSPVGPGSSASAESQSDQAHLEHEASAKSASAGATNVVDLSARCRKSSTHA